ncbi:glycosyltransferase family 10 domain-containing protein [Cerasicoccus maritimus]|uniref:glycosyltransferase family 10 domain-containing protein n=1 Tax=Cerasicoccus maritimus TaxID=490089 RepID=UPI002852BABB|nr:glycosyltransferase family 10 [Cerasicoccus maritimus]
METVRPKIKVAFVDFWKAFRPETDFFVRQLQKVCQLEISDTPDFIFYAEDKERQHLQMDGVRIFLAVEDCMPNYRVCDYSFTFKDLPDERNLRLPFYVLRGNGPEPLIRQDAATEAKLRGQRRRFCAFVSSNANPRRTARRISFFQKLHAQRHVDSGGRAFNNVGGPVPDKHAFIKGARFCLSMENYAMPGYTTEKLYESMAARCIPIFWGNPDVAEDFNPASFIDIADFASDTEAVDYILEVDRDERLQAQYHEAPFFPNNEPTKYFRDDYLLPQLEKILSTTKKRRSHFYFGDVVYDLRKRWGFHASFVAPNAGLGPRYANAAVD